MRNANPRLRFFVITLLFLAELMLAINLIQMLRSYSNRHSGEESALQSALMVVRIQTAIPQQSQQNERLVPPTSAIGATQPAAPTPWHISTLARSNATATTTTIAPTLMASPTALAVRPSLTPTATPSVTSSSTSLSPTPLPPTPLPPTPIAVTNTATPLPPVVTATATIQMGNSSSTTRISAVAALPTQAPPATATAFYITPTPAALDLFSAATLVARLTANALTTGTATPQPANWRVYTVRILPYEPTAANAATATVAALEATARALTTGEATAGVLFWTATPRPTNPPPPTVTATMTRQPTMTATDTATPFVVTATFTPENVLAAATIAAQATAQAATIGTATPLPANALFATNTPRPIIVTNTPTAANNATAVAMAIEATAIAYTTGTAESTRFITATPTAPRVVAGRPVATATPLFFALSDLTATPTPNATTAFPPELLGKILFLGEMDGRGAPETYVMDADGSNIARLSSQEFYLRAVERDSFSADRRFHAFVKREEAGTRERQIYAYDAFYTSERQLTNMKSGSTSWDPVWSPSTEVIAFVTNQTDSDEIWLVERESRQVTQLTFNDGPWDKHPSWSPDGSQLVYMSSRTGQRAIWIMQSNGSNQRQLTTLAFEAWDPVWVKYTDQ